MPDTNPVAITKKLIQIESSDPGTYEISVSDYILNYLKELPSSVVQITEEEVLDGRKNIMAVIPKKTYLTNPKKNPDIVLICHMDTVPIGNDWTMPPLDALTMDAQTMDAQTMNAQTPDAPTMDARIYGRGACDMKSGLACALTAFAETALAVSSGASLTHTLRFIATVDEEDEMRGVEKALSSGWIPSDALIMDTEPTNRRILTGHKGRLWFHLTIQGHAAHASNPWEGADAIAGMAEAISYIRQNMTTFPGDDYFGASSVCFGQITGGTVPYAVSDSCTVTIDMRLVPPADSEQASALLDAAIAYAAEQIPGISGHYKITGNRPPVPYYADSQLLKRLSDAYETVLKSAPEIAVFTGYTDSAVAAGVLQNKNCLSFGPGNLEMAHKPDEYVPVKDIVDCKAVIMELIQHDCLKN